MKKRMIIFDLDGTLAQSKQPLDGDMAQLLTSLLQHGYEVAIMSGGSFAQYEQQVIPFLPVSVYENLFLAPTSGAALYRYRDQKWEVVYNHTIPSEDRAQIIRTLHEAATVLNMVPNILYGEQIEDRHSQITYSALGQRAPIDKKSVWDPNQIKRRTIAEYFSARLPQYEVHIGGMTSIDITKKGVDKTYGIRQLSRICSISITDMVYVGDALYPGGNDEPARASGIECVPVTTVDDTKRYIRSLIASRIV